MQPEIESEKKQAKRLTAFKIPPDLPAYPAGGIFFNDSAAKTKMLLIF